MEEQLISIFCDVDDFCKEFESTWHSFMKETGLRSRFRRDTLALSELMTIAIMFHFSQIRTFKSYYFMILEGIRKGSFLTFLAHSPFKKVGITISSSSINKPLNQKYNDVEMQKRYRTDLTDNQWKFIEPLIPAAKEGGRPRTTDMREVVNACLYMARSGCQWDLLPRDFPPRSTVFEYFSSWSKDGTFDQMMSTLRERVRLDAGRSAKPSAAIMDSQSIKTAGPAIEKGFDGNKRIKGRKRHLAVDILGLVLGVVVHSAGIHERAGAKLLLSRLMPLFSGIKIIWADGGYSGKPFKSWVKQVFDTILKVVKRPRKKFQIVKFRWVVERTFGWMNSQRRLSKDYEYLPRHSEGWIKLVAINTMTRRLSPG